VTSAHLLLRDGEQAWLAWLAWLSLQHSYPPDPQAGAPMEAAAPAPVERHIWGLRRISLPHLGHLFSRSSQAKRAMASKGKKSLIEARVSYK
jgi:hypothetical protein